MKYDSCTVMGQFLLCQGYSLLTTSVKFEFFKVRLRYGRGTSVRYRQIYLSHIAWGSYRQNHGTRNRKSIIVVQFLNFKDKSRILHTYRGKKS